MGKGGKVILQVNLFMWRDGRFLLMHHTDSGQYWLPSGFANEGELPTTAAIMEGRARTSVDFKTENLQFVHVMHTHGQSGASDRVDYFFDLFKWQGGEKILEGLKFDHMIWVLPTVLPEHTDLKVRVVLDAINSGIRFSER